MRSLLDVLHLDENYSSLHSTNYRRCLSDLEKERYRKQLYNSLSRRNAHIHQEICVYQKVFQAYRARRPSKRRAKTRNASKISRPIILPRSECR